MDGMGKDGGRSAEIVCTLEINIGSCARDHVRGIMCEGSCAALLRLHSSVSCCFNGAVLAEFLLR
jgi:hypothetical protein